MPFPSIPPPDLPLFPEQQQYGGEAAWERTPLGKILRIVGKGEELGTAAILRPLAEMVDPSTAEKFRSWEGPLYAGDVLNTLLPPSEEYPSVAEKIARGLGGVALGAAVDPLSYLAVGGLTKTGKAARSAGALAETGVKQAALGQKALLQLRSPLALEGGISLLPRKADVAIARALETSQRGRVGRELLGRVGLKELGAFYDSLTNVVAQKFNFNIGAHPFLTTTHNELWGKIVGQGGRVGTGIVDEMEAATEIAAKRFSDVLQIDPHDAYVRYKDALNIATEMHPRVKAFMDAKTGAMRFRAVPFMDDTERARRAIMQSFSLPPSFGGPASPMDTELTRLIREHVMLRKRRNLEVLAQDEQRIGHNLWQVTHPDAGYSAHIGSQEGLSEVNKATKDMIRRYSSGREYAAPPAEHIMHEIGRTMRMVDPQGFQDFRLKGYLDPFEIRTKVRGDVKVRTIDPVKVLQPDLRGLMSRKSQRIIKVMADRGILSWDRGDPNYVGLLVGHLSVDDANKFIWENGWRDLIKPHAVEKFFETDPTVIDVTRALRTDRAMLSQEWFNAIKEYGRNPLKPDQSPLLFQKGDPAMPAEFRPVNGIPELDGWYMDPDDYKFLRRYYEADINLGSHLRKFLHVFNQGNMAFKAWTLSTFPSWHAKNAVGSSWLYYLGSENTAQAVRDIRRSTTAWKAIRGGSAKADQWTLRGVTNPATGKEWTAKEIWKEGQDNHLWGTGIFSHEDPKAVQQQISYMRRWGVTDPEHELMKHTREEWKRNGRRGSPFVGPPSPTVAEKIKLGFLGENKWIEAGFRIGAHVDDHYRMAHLLQKLSEGESMRYAIRSTKKYLLDYTQISPFERKWMRTAMPFYTWARKNIPLQLEMLIRRPDRAARFHGWLQGYESSEETPGAEQWMSRYQREGFPLRVRKGKDGKYQVFLLRNWHPLVDVQEMFDILNWGTMQMTPFAKLPLEQILNINLMTDRKIDKMNDLLQGERTQMGTLKGVLGEKALPGVSVPNRVAHILKSIRWINTMHTLLDNPKDADAVVNALWFLAGKTYPLDPARGAWEFRDDMEELRSSMQSSMRSAVARGDNESLNRLLQSYMKKQEKLLESRGMK